MKPDFMSLGIAREDAGSRMTLSQETCRSGTIYTTSGDKKGGIYDDLFIIVYSIPGWKLIRVF
jgi:hypothetical protein